jgi:hypothetical protein
VKRPSIVMLLAVTVLAAVSYGTAASGAVARAKQRSGVTGRVTAGPTCPVEQVGHPCPPRPVTATIKAQQGRRVVARARSDSNGHYAMTLAPGRYTLLVQTGSQFPRCPATAVSVPANQVVTADISCDTGIR